MAIAVFSIWNSFFKIFYASYDLVAANILETIVLLTPQWKKNEAFPTNLS